MLSSWMTKKAITVEKRQVESSRAALSSRRLSRTAQALLPKSSQTTDDLEAILRRIVILNPKTIACMIQATKESREALQELTPCQISLRDFQARCGGNVDSKLVYKIVKEAVGQCDDYVEFYSRSPPFYPTMRFSGQTLPPFASYDDDVDLQNLSDNYWNAELAIESIHRQAPPDCKIDPGFSSECISILCHAFEVGETTSPIGVNFFTVRPEGSV